MNGMRVGVAAAYACLSDPLARAAYDAGDAEARPAKYDCGCCDEGCDCDGQDNRSEEEQERDRRLWQLVTLTVPQLERALRERQLEVEGSRPALLRRLHESMEGELDMRRVSALDASQRNLQFVRAQALL